jgi:hypothetical protein
MVPNTLYHHGENDRLLLSSVVPRTVTPPRARPFSVLLHRSCLRLETAACFALDPVCTAADDELAVVAICTFATRASLPLPSHSAHRTTALLSLPHNPSRLAFSLHFCNYIVPLELCVRVCTESYSLSIASTSRLDHSSAPR